MNTAFFIFDPVRKFSFLVGMRTNYTKIWGSIMSSQNCERIWAKWMLQKKELYLNSSLSRACVAHFTLTRNGAMEQIPLRRWLGLRSRRVGNISEFLITVKARQSPMALMKNV